MLFATDPDDGSSPAPDGITGPDGAVPASVFTALSAYLGGAQALSMSMSTTSAAPSSTVIASTAQGGLDINTAGNDAYLLADDGSGLLGGRTALTLEAQFSLIAASGDSTLLSYAVDASSDNEVSLAITSAGRVDLRIGGSLISTSSNHAQLHDGTRHQVSVSWDAAGGNVVFYIDGTQVQSTTGFMAGYTVAASGTLLLGQDQDIELGNFEAAQAFSGTLFDLRIFEGARSAGDVSANALATLAYNTTGLRANWTFNDLSSGGVVTDTVSANNLTLDHATGVGYTANQPELTLALAENSANGTVVGSVVGSDLDRSTRISDLIAADGSLRYSAEASQFYRLVSGITSWTGAEASARSGAGMSLLNGVTGQLVNIRSATQNEVVWYLAQDYATDVWIGASDLGAEGTWRWIQNGAPADTFWSGGLAGSVVGGAYANWDAGEPNNATGENHGMLYVATGHWNDIADISAFTPAGYVVQWDADAVLDATHALTYALVSQSVPGAFTIDSDSGRIMVANGSLLNRETQAAHSITVRTSDGSQTHDQTFSIALSNVYEVPVITSNGGGATSSVSVNENSTAVTTVSASLDITGTATYTITGGADSARFAVNAASGALSFVAAPSHGAPTDANGDNIYLVTVQVADGLGGIDTQALSVTVNTVSQAPVITSQGGGVSAALQRAENSTSVTTVTSTDVDGDTPVYSIAGGADAARFAIDGSTGALSFVTAPDYERPADADADNVYQVTVQASDGVLADTQALTVTVTAANDNAPVITSLGGSAAAALSVAENTSAVTTVAATDADLPAATLVYSIAGGADAARFAINGSTGALSFVTAPNYENPADADADNVYQVTVQASDGILADTQALAVTVTAANDNAPVITSLGGAAAAALSVAENTSVVTTVEATDADRPPATLVYSISGGADAARFAIHRSTGVLSFVTAPNHESPADANADNVYQVTVQASDGTQVDTQTLSVAVSDVNEAAPVVTTGQRFVLAENSSTGAEVGRVLATDADSAASLSLWTISGGNIGGAFDIEPATGRLSVADASQLDFETLPTYTLRVRVSDGSFVSGEQTVTIALSDVQEQVVAPAPVPEAANVPGLPPAGGGMPLLGDGNGDGLLDNQQANVWSAVFVVPAAGSNATGTGSTFVTLVADSDKGKTSPDPGDAQIIRTSQLAAPVDLPEGMNMPLGLLGFAALIGTPGGTETFSVYVDAQLGVNGYWSETAAGIWVNLASPAYGGNTAMEGGRLRLDFQITDGGEFDADGQANGSISDAGAPGFLPQSITEYPPILPFAGYFWF